MLLPGICIILDSILCLFHCSYSALFVWGPESQELQFLLTVSFLLGLFVTRDSQTSLLAEASVPVRRGRWEEQWFCERRLHHLDASVGLCHVPESLPAPQTRSALRWGPASRELHLPDFLQYPLHSLGLLESYTDMEVNRICGATGKEAVRNTAVSGSPGGIWAMSWLTRAFGLVICPLTTNSRNSAD